MSEKFVKVQNPNGPELAYSPDSGVKIIEKDGLKFKDLAKTGELLPYEDWRLSAEERAKDLASRLSVEQIAGLMLYSPHQMVPPMPVGPFPGTFGGKSLAESGANEWDVTDQQKKFLTEDNIRHVLATRFASTEVAAKWNNEMQALTESLPLGLPVNTSSDPRHGASLSDAEYHIGNSGSTSKWPDGLGMSATFSPELCRRFGEVASKEYRALGIATALSPQIDLATEPRWMRFGDTFGEHAALSADLARAYCDGFQTTEGEPDGWGKDSVNAMAKHWPGGGAMEGGRDAHYAWGKFGVYPGNNFDEHLKPFVDGAFKLDGPTKQASAIMPYYSIAWGQDKLHGENVGNSYSEYMIHDLLREKYGYEGVVCTDWGITGPHGEGVEGFNSRCWGVEHLSTVEQHLKIIMNGVDQFGGNADKQPVIDAYKLGCEKYGEKVMRERFEASAVRLLKNTFRCGLFENPYLDPAESEKVVGSAEFCEEGYKAQLASVIMVKNKGTLPLSKGVKVYVPSRHIDSTLGFMRWPEKPRDFDPVPRELLEKYFTVVDTPEEADVGLVFIETPITNPYDANDLKNGGNGYFPVSLQYRPYTARLAREHSIGQGDPYEKENPDRSYKGKTVHAANESDLDNILNTKAKMGAKPVVVVGEMNKPIVPAEFEPSADAILMHFGVQAQAVLDILVGNAEPSALLPVQLPKDMDTVETNMEDVPFDVTPYTDECGNTYDFGFGMNWSGSISDARTEKYKKTR